MSSLLCAILINCPSIPLSEIEAAQRNTGDFYQQQILHKSRLLKPAAKKIKIREPNCTCFASSPERARDQLGDPEARQMAKEGSVIESGADRSLIIYREKKERKILAYGRHQLSRPMRKVGPI